MIDCSVGCFVLKKAKVADDDDTPGRVDCATAVAVQPAQSLDEVGRRMIQLISCSLPSANLAHLVERWLAAAELTSQGGGITPAYQLELLEYSGDGQATRLSLSKAIP